MGFADVRKGMSPQMHHKCTTQGQCLGRLFNLGCLYCKRKCRLVLSGAHGRMVQFGNFLQEERIIGKVLAEPFKFFAGRDSVIVAQIVKSQQDAGKRHKKTAVISNQRELFYALLLVTFESAKAQHPADRSCLAADNVFAHASGNVDIVIIGRARQQALRIAISWYRRER